MRVATSHAVCSWSSGGQEPISPCAWLGAGKGSVHERAQALRFLQICLASALNLRSPADSALPGTAADKLAAMLFGGQACTCQRARSGVVVVSRHARGTRSSGQCAVLALSRDVAEGFSERHHVAYRGHAPSMGLPCPRSPRRA